MWGRLHRLILTYTALVCLSNAVLYFMAEKRFDAYISINVLIFYITYAIYRPLRSSSLRVKLLHTALLTLFLAIVVYRVYQVITG